MTQPWWRPDRLAERRGKLETRGRVLQAVRETEGACISVSDAQILAMVKELASLEGTLICPEGAAVMAAAIKLKESGAIGRDERVLLLNTGSGLKYPDLLAPDLPVLNVADDI